MARRKQEGNRFFRLDVDFFSDKKVKILKARYGADGGEDYCLHTACTRPLPPHCHLHTV